MGSSGLRPRASEIWRHQEVFGLVAFAQRYGVTSDCEWMTMQLLDEWPNFVAGKFGCVVGLEEVIVGF